MNLKDRLNKEEKKPENSSNTTQTSNQQSTEQILLSKVLELSDALNEEKQRALSQAQTISELTSQRSILTSKTQEQQSIIAALKTEIHEAQDINRSLQKGNQTLRQENDDLRFNHGVESLKEVDDLRDEICRLHLKIAELNKQVDHSTVAAVNKAYKELEENDQKAKKKMQDFRAYANKKIREYVNEIEKRNGIIKSQHARIRSEKNKLWLYRDLLLLYILCTLTADPVILLDVWELLTDAYLSFDSYCDWFMYPCYAPYPGAVPVPYGSGTAWTVRTASVIAILISVILLSRIGRRAYSRIRTQWCRLAARISLSLLIIISVLGSVIKEYLHWNTAVLFLTIFAISMRLMRRYENSFARSRMTDDWKQIKEHNEKSYYVTYHIYRFLTQERGPK